MEPYAPMLPPEAPSAAAPRKSLCSTNAKPSAPTETFADSVTVKEMTNAADTSSGVGDHAAFAWFSALLVIVSAAPHTLGADATADA